MSSNEENNLKPEGTRLEPENIRRCGGPRLIRIPFIIAAIILIKSAVVMVIWNALIPDLFHGPVLTYVQALGLSVLAKLLVGFGGFGPFGGHRHGGHHWKHHWAKLSPEEREKLREDMRKKMGVSN